MGFTFGKDDDRVIFREHILINSTVTGKDHEGVLGVQKMFCFHLVSDNTHGKYSTCVRPCAFVYVRDAEVSV